MAMSLCQNPPFALDLVTFVLYIQRPIETCWCSRNASLFVKIRENIAYSAATLYAPGLPSHLSERRIGCHTTELLAKGAECVHTNSLGAWLSIHRIGSSGSNAIKGVYAHPIFSASCELAARSSRSSKGRTKKERKKDAGTFDLVG